MHLLHNLYSFLNTNTKYVTYDASWSKFQQYTKKILSATDNAFNYIITEDNSKKNPVIPLQLTTNDS